jgi:hypothetical protein
MSQNPGKFCRSEYNYAGKPWRVSKLIRLILLQISLITILAVSACARLTIANESEPLINTSTSTLTPAPPTFTLTPSPPTSTLTPTLPVPPSTVFYSTSTAPSIISTTAMEINIPQEPYIGIWISKEELAALPTNGPAWEALKAAADKDPGIPVISDQDQNNDIYVLAEALVYARTGEMKYRQMVIDNLMKAVDTEKGGRTLALGRNLPGYVISADLINLPSDSQAETIFRGWLVRLLSENLDGRTLQSTHEDRPNNWGTHAGAARAAVAMYLGDKVELKRTATVFHGYLGDTSAYDNFKYGDDLSWQCDPAHPLGINAMGCMKDGHSIDGALPEEMRRGDSFQWPPIKTGYAWEALQGAFVQAQILNRVGFPTWDWQDQALLRAVNFLYSIDWKPEGDDEWLVWLINHVYGTSFSAALPAKPGKNMGWTDWTYSN